MSQPPDHTLHREQSSVPALASVGLQRSGRSSSTDPRERRSLIDPYVTSRPAEGVDLVRSSGASLLRGAPRQAALAASLHPLELKVDGDTGEEFNQAELIANHISEEFGIECLRALITKRRPLKMRGLRREERLRRARQVYGLNEARLQELRDVLRGSVVLLVDDVRTTGATGLACAEALKQVGASRAYLLVAGRATFPGAACGRARAASRRNVAPRAPARLSLRKAGCLRSPLSAPPIK